MKSNPEDYVLDPGTVKTRIKDELVRKALLYADAIQVENVGNKIVLRGSVRTWAEREDVEKAAWSAPGVTEVEDRIHVPG